MTTPNKTVEEIVQEFERKLWKYTKGELDKEDISGFFLAQITAERKRAEEVLGRLEEEIKKQEKKLPKHFECVDCVSLGKELERDDAKCAMCNGERGFNVGIATALALFEKAREELSGKK